MWSSDLRSGGNTTKPLFLQKLRLLRRHLKALCLYLMDLCLCVSSSFSERCQSSAHKQPHTSHRFKGGCLVLNRAAHVLGGACQQQPQLSGRSKMADLWTGCHTQRGRRVLCQMLWLHGYPVYLVLFLTDRDWRLLLELRTEQEWLEIINEGHLEFMHECVWMHNR